MYNVLDVCRYVINYSNQKDYGISNLKLQKILYFIQAFFLVSTEKHEPCFKEKIEAWDFGPVVPEAYYEYKQYGSCDIPPIKTYIIPDYKNLWNSQKINYDDTVITSNDKYLINLVIDKFADYSATDLVSLTHKQSPWINAYESHKNNEITIKAIKDFFNE